MASADTLFESLKKAAGRRNEGSIGKHPLVDAPVAPQTLRTVETRLGYRLPTILKRIYLEIANGGFGPGHSLFRLHAGCENLDNLLDFNETQRRDSKWPTRLIAICEYGCGVFYCLNIDDQACDDPPVYKFDIESIHIAEPMSSFTIEAPSLSRWLEEWCENDESGLRRESSGAQLRIEDIPL